MTKKDESTVTEDDVWKEHLRAVHQGRHWAYLLGVLGGSFTIMVTFIAWLGN